MSREYKYDVAFSFLQEDEQLALEIANRIRDRVSVNVFVYSERQDDLASADGVDQFSLIFGEQSRVVVILYRENWGQTRWTRVEENAIRARGFNEGHGFLLLVKLDSAQPPVWLPPTRLWLGYERYGIDGVASVIEARVQAVGGSVRGESVADYAARIDRQISFNDKRRAFLTSEQGVGIAKREVEDFFSELQRLVAEINRQNGIIQLGFERSGFNFGGVSTDEIRFGVTWGQRWGNNLENAGLTFILTEGGMFLGGHAIKQPTHNERVSYDVDLDLSEKAGWRECQGKKRFFTSAQLAEFWIKHLLDRIHRRASK